jgi:mRNA-degrading endonuclease toxin of MazEF toxin-antitoxin module
VILNSLATVDKVRLAERVGSLPAHTWAQIERAIDAMLDRTR